MGTLAHADALVCPYVQAAGVPFLTVDCRLAPEVQGRTPVEDALADFIWLLDHIPALGIAPRRIAVMGGSANYRWRSNCCCTPYSTTASGISRSKRGCKAAPILVCDAVYTGCQSLLGQEPGPLPGWTPLSYRPTLPRMRD